ncbi:probable protein arginine N-methyltransferase 1.2 isoform X2 [Ooceraea biroi]|uniref:probable protein arginine N-methyltransferase 1.2 isoform X2 n=1 Tax=Ooceraea biroi TaxID=2015173 RepID=UPI000F07DCDD|nr:probable protein arginine N-methyltransferase 1.2 isoform X2 [Ooceraea biroi]
MDQYFKSYEEFDVHHLMLSDNARVLAYKTAIFNCKEKFQDKIVMDVGAGSGILSIFCAQAGAKKIYAVEASMLARTIEQVLVENNVQNKVEVIHCKVEDICPSNVEKVDIIVSEWMGFYLVHEGMLDSVLYARDNFLREDGLLFPSVAKLYASPCQLPSMYEFWDDVYGVSMRCIGKEYRKVKSEKPEILLLNRNDLLAEDGSELSTGPCNEATHWKQTAIVLPTDIEVLQHQPVAFKLTFEKDALNSRCYNIKLILLDAEEIEHDIPCNCHMTKCIVTKTYIESQSNEESV